MHHEWCTWDPPTIVLLSVPPGDGQMHHSLQLHIHLSLGGTYGWRMYDKNAYMYIIRTCICMCMWSVLCFTQICQPKRGVKSTQPHPRGHPTRISSITASIKRLVPPHHSPNRDVPLASTNNPAILEHLQCPICMDILFQPLELPCRTLVCTACIVTWFTTFDCNGVMCPCCRSEEPLMFNLPQSLFKDGHP